MDLHPGLDRETILEIVREVSFKVRKANNEVFKPYGIRLSNKNLSEIIGKIMERTSAEILSKKLGYEVRNAQSDSEPDLLFTRINRPLEIKVTSTQDGWIGGEFSERPYDYFLVSWGGDYDEYFVAYLHLDKKDWHSNISKRFYGPTYSAKTLYENKKKLVLLGDFSVSSRGSVKIRREIVRRSV
ncbi:MAG: hypothetical protein ABSC50_07120 [Candidatus Bathyarchaeia archaeon]